jgi:hypothetical protein
VDSQTDITAVRQIETGYKFFIDDFVRDVRAEAAEGTGHPVPLTPGIIATAHERAWRHGVVRAARATSALEWARLTVGHEAAVYEHLLGWTAAKYHVDEAAVRAAQPKATYRQAQR